MPNRSTHRNMLVAIALIGGNEAIPVNSASVECAGADAVAFHITPTAVGGAGGTLTLEESDDDVTYTAVDPLQVESADNVLAANVPIAVAYLGNKPYVQAVITPSTDVDHEGLVVVKDLLEQLPVNPVQE